MKFCIRYQKKRVIFFERKINLSKKSGAVDLFTKRREGGMTVEENLFPQVKQTGPIDTVDINFCFVLIFPKKKN